MVMPASSTALRMVLARSGVTSRPPMPGTAPRSSMAP